MAEQKKMGRPANGATEILGISITPELKKRIMARARTERRSASSLACSMLENAFTTSNSTAPAPAPQSEAPTAKRKKTGGRLNQGATALLTISLQPELKEAVKRVADMESRTASNMACLMLRDWILEWELKHPGVDIWGGVEEES